MPTEAAAAGPSRSSARTAGTLRDELARFTWEGRATRVEALSGDGISPIPVFINEFWTSRQRAAHTLHEISYRACFKPQLPRFFIDRLTGPGDRVYDPFMGRGTTIIEAALAGREVAGCDVNPLSPMLVEPRLRPPSIAAIASRLASIDLEAVDLEPDDDSSVAGEPPESGRAPGNGASWSFGRPTRDDLLAFFHPRTLRAIALLRAYFLQRAAEGTLDDVDRWIRLMALNRLTGHSPGFFSVYTLPPNQAVSPESQRKINAERGQQPPERDVRALILRKSRALLSGCTPLDRVLLEQAARGACLMVSPADRTPALADGSVHLVVTSPPFLDIVDYAGDNWLRCWFAGIDPRSVAITRARRLADWQETMTAVFRELARVLVPGGHVAFEVGEVRGGAIRLEEAVVPSGIAAGLEPCLVLINAQQFTKTANCWGVANNAKGTNSNRVVLFVKP